MQPLTRHLPHDSARFRIDYHLDAAGGLFLTIELRVVLNRADQLVGYDEELRTCRAEALAWLRSVGADPDSLAVLPPTARGRAVRLSSPFYLSVLCSQRPRRRHVHDRQCIARRCPDQTLPGDASHQGAL